MSAYNYLLRMCTTHTSSQVPLHSAHQARRLAHALPCEVHLLITAVTLVCFIASKFCTSSPPPSTRVPLLSAPSDECAQPMIFCTRVYCFLTSVFCASSTAPNTCAPLFSAAASLSPAARASCTASFAAASAVSDWTAAGENKCVCVCVHLCVGWCACICVWGGG